MIILSVFFNLLQFQTGINDLYDNTGAAGATSAAIGGTTTTSSMCTLPRQHWPNRNIHNTTGCATTIGMSVNPSVVYNAGTNNIGIINRRPVQCHGNMILSQDLDGNTIPIQCCMPINSKDLISKVITPPLLPPNLISKRESSV